MTPVSTEILERFGRTHGKVIDLTLRQPYLDLLTRLGNPHLHLPPTLIVAGTNGKGSTCAFLRALIEAQGKTAHVYTSPHLVRYHERIRIAGALIEEAELVALLREVETHAQEGSITAFEAETAVALTAFARHPADAVILEVGLGGRLDATNIVPAPVASVITRLSFDHRDYLGDTMTAIAREKAGILRRATPCFTAPQPSDEALATLRAEAMRLNAPLFVGGTDWRVTIKPDGLFDFESGARTIRDIPPPALVGVHQYWNAGLALAASHALPFTISDSALREAMRKVKWQGRLQRLTHGPLVAGLPQGSELWLDGGHNDSAGEVLAAQIKLWARENPKPLDLVLGMMSTKSPEEFLTPFANCVRHVRTVRVDGLVPGFTPESLAVRLTAMGLQNVAPAASVQQALAELTALSDDASRTMICGSLYLVGEALRQNS